MKHSPRILAFVGSMTLTGTSVNCANEVIAPDIYNLDFQQAAIDCGRIEHDTPYDKAHYCAGLEDTDKVMIDAFYDTSYDTRIKITAAVTCILAPLKNVRIEMQSVNPDAILTHFGGLARPDAIGKGTYDEGNSNRLPDAVYLADRYQNSSASVVPFETGRLTIAALHEMGHTLGLVHSQIKSIMSEAIVNPFPFYFTREDAELLLKNTNDKVTEEKIEQLTKADERCADELSAFKK